MAGLNSNYIKRKKFNEDLEEYNKYVKWLEEQKENDKAWQDKLDVAEKLHNETKEEAKDNKSNYFQKGSAKELSTGEKDKKVAATEFAIDLAPAVVSTALGHAVKNSNSYKNAKIREFGENTKFSEVDPKLVFYTEKSVLNPEGLFGKIIYNLYGKPMAKKTNRTRDKYYNKFLEEGSKIIKGFNGEKFSDIVHKYTTGEKALTSEEMAIMKLRAKYDRLANNEIKKYMKYTPEVISETFDGNYKIGPHGKIIIDRPVTDEAILQAPTVLNTLGAVGGAGAVANLASDLRKPDSGGVIPTSAGLVDLIDNVFPNWRFSDKDLIDQINKKYDEIMASGDKDKQEEFLNIFLKTDFKSKDSLRKSLEKISAL